MTFIRLLLVLSVISGTETLHAQSAPPPPDFSGRWFIDKATLKASAARPFWTACGWECTIAQTAGLTVTPATGTVRTFAIDGRPVTTTIEGFGQATTQTTTARWEKQRLLITVTTGSTGEFTATTQLALDAGRLVVTTTRDGGGRGGGQETAIYLKK